MVAATPELLNGRWLHGETPLHFLAVEGRLEAVRLLAALGTDVNKPNSFGDSALIDAITLGESEVVKLLLQLGADPNFVSPTSDHALHCAARSGRSELVEALLAAGADPAYRTELDETIADVLPADPEERRRIIDALERAERKRQVNEPHAPF